MLDLIQYYTTLRCVSCSDEFLFILFPIKNSRTSFGVEPSCARCVKNSIDRSDSEKYLAYCAEEKYIQRFPQLKYSITLLTAEQRDANFKKIDLSIKDILWS